MANELSVSADSLRAAAASSESLAAGLTDTHVGSPSASHHSAAGVAAVHAALTAMQARQSARMTGQAGDLSVSGALYDATDTDGRDAISGTVSV